LHREVVGYIRGVIIKRKPFSWWFAYLLVDNGQCSSEPTAIDSAVGIDVGLEHYAVDSDGYDIENPRHLKQALKKLRKEQRRFCTKQKGSIHW
jgi:putative transposase